MFIITIFIILLCGLMIRFKVPYDSHVVATVIDYRTISIEDEKSDVYVGKSVIVPVYDYMYDGREYTVAGNGKVVYDSMDDAAAHIGDTRRVYVQDKNPDILYESVSALQVVCVITMILGAITLLGYCFMFVCDRFFGYAEDNISLVSLDNK